MATRHEREEILAQYEPVDKESWQRHVAAFVKSFVVREKRARWTHILLNKPEKVRRDGHTLIGALDRNYCGPGGRSLLSNHQHQGVYYEFSGKALWLPVEAALSIGQQVDAIFSVEPGKLAVFFNHEFLFYEEWICAR